MPFHSMMHHNCKPVMFVHWWNDVGMYFYLPETINQSELYAISSSLLIGWAPQAVSVSTKYPDAKQNWQRGDCSVQLQCCVVCVCVRAHALMGEFRGQKQCTCKWHQNAVETHNIIFYSMTILVRAFWDLFAKRKTYLLNRHFADVNFGPC